MKNSRSIIAAILFPIFALCSFSFTAMADGGNCNKNYRYDNVSNGDTYQMGQDIYIKVKAENHLDIANMTLYINGHKIRTEMKAPYEWGRPNGTGDNYLRNLKKGTYRLTCVARTQCGGKYKKEINFYVNQASQAADVISFQADKMNVLYIGVDNPLTIESANNNVLQVAGSDDNISIEQTGKNKYIATAKKEGNFRINISSAEGTKTIPVRVKRIPDPIARLGRSIGGSMGSGEFKAQAGLHTYLDNFDFDVSCSIIGFELLYISKGQAPVYSRNGGARYNEKSKGLIALAKPGDIYIFQNVQAKCPGDSSKRKINTLVFHIR